MACPSRKFLLALLSLSTLPLTQVVAQTKQPAAKTPAKPTATKPATPAAKPSLTPGTKPATAPVGVTGAVGPIPAMPRIYAPTRPREVNPRYPWKEKIATTVFWIGEQPTERNPVPNHASSWDTTWQLNYGGYDDPSAAGRNWDFAPKAFVPKLNPFYVALPFNDVTNREIAKLKIPWYKSKSKSGSRDSVCEDRWLAIKFNNKLCFAQWCDCGPFNTDDHDYVFGNSRPKNQENEGAGLDVSPAVRDYLGMSSGALCDWRFVEDDEVLDGPWRRYGKNNGFVKNDATELAKLRAEYQALVKKRDEWLKNNINDYKSNAVQIR
jgi:hypothetical protein